MSIFKIKKGNHYPTGIHFGITFSNTLEFEARFDETCLYSFDDNDIYDINKLYGLSTSYHHHVQSARFGWRCLDGENIEILTYSYDNSERLQSEVLGTVKPNENFYCKLEIKKDKFIYNFNNVKTVEVEKGNSWWMKYRLYPYFGGNKTAPHDMFIYINKK